MMRFVIPVFLSVMLALSAPAYAAGGETEDDTSNNKTVELLGLVVPIEHEGKLINYLFLSVRLHIADGHDQWKYRDIGHILRHNILKAAHKETVGLEGNPMQIDEDRAQRVFKKALADVMGEGALKDVEFTSIDSLKVFPNLPDS